ncbi:hypothetical protein AVEN_215735-1, partial [Araneus ventricosus]
MEKIKIRREKEKTHKLPEVCEDAAQLLSFTMRLFSSHMKLIRSRSRVLDKLFVKMFFNYCNLSGTLGVWKYQEKWRIFEQVLEALASYVQTLSGPQNLIDRYVTLRYGALNLLQREIPIAIVKVSTVRAAESTTSGSSLVLRKQISCDSLKNFRFEPVAVFRTGVRGARLVPRDSEGASESNRQIRNAA